MKKPFKNTTVGKILIGAADAFTGGTVSNVVYHDETTPAGSIDFKRAGASVATLLLIAAYVAGKVKIEDLLQIIGALGYAN